MNRLEAWIGAWACLILSNTSEPWWFFAIAWGVFLFHYARSK